MAASRSVCRQEQSMTERKQTRLLHARNVEVRYGDTVALRDATIDIFAGESVAIMGPSGSGKSTLLHVLAGIIQPQSGCVTLADEHAGADVDITGLSDDDRSSLRLRRFGFVFQQGLLTPELTAAENVALPLLLTGRSRQKAFTRAHEELVALGLAGLENRRIGQLSGGQAQRVAVARALIHRPQIVFADEPTGALDSQTADEVLTLLINERRAHDYAVVIVTHDERVAARCTRVIRVFDGRIDSGAGQ